MKETSPDSRLRHLEQENAELRSLLALSREEHQSGKFSQLTALNLMEDAVSAQSRAERLNRELHAENIERRRIENALRSSEERLRTLFNSMNEAFAVKEAILDEEGVPVDYRFIECNPAFTRHTGLADPCGKTVRELIPGIEAEWLKLCRGVLETGEPAQREGYVKTLGRWFKISASRLGDEGSPRIALVFTDMTEARRAQEALRDSEERLRTLSDAVPQIIWTNDREGRADYFNLRWFEYSGLTLQESVELGWQKIVHPADAPASAREWSQAQAAGEIFDREYRLRRHDGEYRWFIGRNIPLRDPEGNVSGWFGTATDIHDLKLAEESVRASEDQLRRAIEEAPIPVIMQAENGEVLKISRTWTELTGYTLEELPTFEDWLEKAYGSGATRAKEHMQHLFQGAERSLDVDLEVVTRTGECRRWAFSASAPGSLRDGRRFIVGMALDITERTRAEKALRENQERLRLIVDNARDYAIFSLDLERRITSWNAGAEAILQYSPMEILGKTGDIIFTAEDRLAGVCEQEARMAMATGRASDERWHVRKNGSVFWASGVMMAMHDADGQTVGLVKIFRDETESRSAQEALERSRSDLITALRENESAKEQVEAASRAKDRFLAILSHELRTPLAPVLMMTMAMQRRKDLDPTLEKALEMISRNVQLECHLIDDLLDLSRFAHGKLEVLRESLDFHHVVRQAVEITHPDLERKNQILEVNLLAEKTSLIGDATRLQQLLWNLLKNASKFTPETGRIQLTTKNTQTHLVVKVSDNGAGIPPDKLALIFEPFAQAESSTTPFGGLGLGLAIAKATIEAHGGLIEARSEGEGSGATFLVSLPLPNSEAPEGNSPTSAAGAPCEKPSK